jgi:hypothetical protein
MPSAHFKPAKAHGWPAVGILTFDEAFLQDRVNLLTHSPCEKCKNGNKLPWSLENNEIDPPKLLRTILCPGESPQQAWRRQC